ncbi:MULTISPECIES: flagellar protein FliT [Lysinibacillus]|uniref:Flagellar protein FliT n=1 Tax=Lysinibacillus fusiformis TaxID=28031 RepID=A0A2I0V5J9_9BACI|nr:MULTISPECIES: flagellar protein FliT [Lysinibacillus]PKU53607.1 flagellar protein FliT [Lysinibacillus fusiformis]SCZ08038.1 flagellar protein FliT [Lysinibacillus sp. SG9]SDB52818.1 flagellar protein FliT [Lysinibacillus sp. TC-37]SFT17130.1 flagellar protein FliT [Lysinibacillus sp. SG55]
MHQTDQLLQVSANLFKHLGDIPNGEERDEYINTINSMLDKRGTIIKGLKQEGFQFDEQNRNHRTLLELDNGIKERLAAVMSAVKQDMANLQKTKKSEQQYFNPYSNVRVMDGMYYDKKN